jgi:AraC-like DNA-binding protein
MSSANSPHTGFAASFAKVVIDYVLAQGHAAQPVLDVLGMSPDQLSEAGQRVPSERLAAALSVACLLCQDDNAPLRIAQMIRPAHLGPLGYALISAPNISEALSLFDRMQRLLCNEMQGEMRLLPDAIEMRVHYLSPMPRDTHLWSFVSSARLSFSRWALGLHLIPLKIALPCPAPQDSGPLLAHLGCPVTFDAPYPSETIPRDWLDLLNPNSDPALHRMMALMTDQAWGGNTKGQDDLVTHLRQLIGLSMQRGQVPTLQALLPELGDTGGTSVRQLQRRLADQRLSFKELLEETRKAQVLHDLAHTDLPLSQVAQRAAYVEMASFHRAVKRWTGGTALAWRASQKRHAAEHGYEATNT